MKTKICIVLNKKYFPSIKLNGGGDLCLPTINNKLILNNSVPQSRNQFINMIPSFEQKISYLEIEQDLQERGLVILMIKVIGVVQLKMKLLMLGMK